MTSQNKRFIPNYQKNHNQLYYILRSVNHHLRNDPKKLKSEYDGLRKKMQLREKLIYRNCMMDYERKCNYEKNLSIVINPDNAIIVKKTIYFTFVIIQIVKFVELEDTKNRFVIPQFIT